MTETPTNAHQPVTEPNRIICAADGCGYAMHTYNPPQGTIDWPHIFRQQHTAQFEPGRAPDISIDYAILAECSVCLDGLGNVQMCHDGDAVCCKDCGTHWDMNGQQGELEEEEEPDAPDEPDATGGLLDTSPDQPPIACGSCAYTTTDIRAAMGHAADNVDHVLAGDGRIEGTTLTISVDVDDDDWED